MMKLAVILGIPLLFLLASCMNGGVQPARITGTIPDGKGQVIVLQEMDTKVIHSVDSATIAPDGSFSFLRDLKEPGFWLLRAPSGKVMVLLLHPGDKAGLTGRMAGFPENVILEGPADAILLDSFFHVTRKRERLVDSLETLLMDRQDTPGYYELTQQVDSMFRRIWVEQRATEKAFIEKNPRSLASLIVLNYAFGMNPVLNPDSDFTEYRKLDSSLRLAWPGNKHVTYHHERVEALRSRKR